MMLATHLVLSLVGIFSGFVVVYGLLGAKPFDRWTAVFLSTTVLTSVTGFLLPADRFLPSHAVGIVSLIVLAIAIPARYVLQLAGGWRRTYVITSVTALYLNCFVLVAQLFMKVPLLNAMAPTQSEPPFAVAQGALLVTFVVLGVRAARNFREASLRMA